MNPVQAPSASAVSRLKADITAGLSQQIVGQEAVLHRLIVAVLAGGHVLLEGVPGLAKTRMARSLAGTFSAEFRRIQFTPDLLPADLLGGMIWRREKERFAVARGPIFANVVLADELNRAPPTVQSALLEAMEEGQVTLGGHTLALPDPFLVLATQNPIEQQGTYPLAEAQLDRFMFQLLVDYPLQDEEREVIDRALDGDPESAVQPIEIGDLRAARALVDHVHVAPQIRDYLVRLVRATRAPEAFGAPELTGQIEMGASPRAAILLAPAMRAHAALEGRDHVLPDDVQLLAPDVLRHRIVPSLEGERQGWDPDRCVARLLERVAAP